MKSKFDEWSNHFPFVKKHIAFVQLLSISNMVRNAALQNSKQENHRYRKKINLAASANRLQ